MFKVTFREIAKEDTIQETITQLQSHIEVKLCQVVVELKIIKRL